MTTNEKAPSAGDAGGLGDTTTFAADSIATDAQRKAESGLLARLALAGHEVHKCRSGDYVVCRWGLTRYCQDFEALQAFARQIGVRS